MTVLCPSVCPSVCPFYWPLQTAVAGLLLWARQVVHTQLPRRWHSSLVHTNEECQRRGNWVWTTYPESLRSRALDGNRTRDILIASPTTYRCATTPPHPTKDLNWLISDLRRQLVLILFSDNGQLIILHQSWFLCSFALLTSVRQNTCMFELLCCIVSVV